MSSFGGVFIYYFLFHFRFLYLGAFFFFNQTTIPLTLVGNEITVVNSTLQAPCWLPTIPHSSRKNYKKPQNVTIASYVEFDTKLSIKNVCECKGLKKAEKQQKAWIHWSFQEPTKFRLGFLNENRFSVWASEIKTVSLAFQTVHADLKNKHYATNFTAFSCLHFI